MCDTHCSDIFQTVSLGIFAPLKSGYHVFIRCRKLDDFSQEENVVSDDSMTVIKKLDVTAKPLLLKLLVASTCYLRVHVTLVSSKNGMQSNNIFVSRNVLLGDVQLVTTVLHGERMERSISLFCYSIANVPNV